MAAKPATKARTTGQTDVDAEQWTDDEIAAMKEHAKEIKTAKGRSGAANKDAEGEADVLAKIAEMPEADRVMAERIHALVKRSAPGLVPRTWYGMPAYANAEGKVVCFFQSADKFKARYATFGFNDSATLDDGSMWPVAFALKKLTAADEKRLAALVKQAAGA